MGDFDLDAKTLKEAGDFSLSEIGTLTLATGEGYAYICIASKGYLYVGLYTSPATIVKIDLATFREVATLTLDANEDTPYSMAIFGNFLYLGLDTTQAKVVKIDLTTFTRVDAINFTNVPVALVVSGGYLYAVENTTPIDIDKINLTTFAVDATLTLGAGEGPAARRGAIISGNYLYIDIQTVPGKIAKVDLTTFTEDGASPLTLAVGETLPFDMVVDKGFLYVVLETAPNGKIAKINLSTFAEDGASPLTLSQPNPWIMKQSGDYLYVATETAFPNPGYVMKIRISTFTEKASIPCTYGQFDAGDIYGDFMYIASESDPANIEKIGFMLPSLLGKVAASAETRVEALDLIVDSVKAQTDKLPRVLCSIDFWGDVIEELQLTGALQANLALAGADVVIAGLPADITIVRVVVMFMCRAIENTHTTNPNNLQGAQNIEVNFGGGAFIDAIAWADNLFNLAAATREDGPTIAGKIDVKATITGNGTCTFRIDAARADQNNLNFNDYQVGVRVYFTI